MDIFMRNIPFTADEVKITLQLEPILHGPVFEPYATSPGLLMNFKVTLFKDRRNPRNRHSGSGTLTLPNENIGVILLRHHSRIMVDNRSIQLTNSNKSPRPDIVAEIRTLPYRDPRAIRIKEARSADLKTHVNLQDVQFGWVCRDDSFSIEWQWNPWHLDDAPRQERSMFDLLLPWVQDPVSGPAFSHHLRFDDDKREIVVERRSMADNFSISMRYSRVQTVETDSSGESTILLTLDSPPSFEKEDAKIAWLRSLGEPNLPKRQKLTSLNAEHERVAPFVWSVLRLVCRSRADLAEFERMAEVASVKVHERRYVTVQRMLFSATNIRLKDQWLCRSHVPWNVRFQCEALLRAQLLDTTELLELFPKIENLILTSHADRVVNVLRQFGLYLRNLLLREGEETVSSCLDRAATEIPQLRTPPAPDASNDNGTYHCLHVMVTPTTMTLRGPFPDTSNRILRRYPNHHDCFLRVSFTDEDRLKFRFDRREVDGPGFIDTRVGGMLRGGFNLCGRHFQFLAYSQSALKEYTMWFVTPFKDRRGDVNAETIRASIGSDWPQDVRRCPARFAARLSQAFTATESAVFVEPDQVERIDDIERNGYCFSDGNGPLTQEMANAIQGALERGSGRANRARRVPSVFQIRIQGAKGTLSVDPLLSGLKICLRPSMIKFESRDSHEIEIARSFTKPGRLFLNRPLVMILAGLGVDEQEFLTLQREAVEETVKSSKTIKGAAKLLETNGLGTAFALPSTLTNLSKLGLNWSQGEESDSLSIRDTFTERSIQYAVNHVLRELKYRARIPVPDSWKLVGVVDVHNILEPHEVYACIVRGDGAKPEYLHGPVVISKSPTIHPGDIQRAIAIGAPPSRSPLKKLTNCVVFSQRGDRPLPNKLSGSDLDGDEYDLLIFPGLHPPRIYEPGEYPAAPKKTLQRDSTIKDVADFVVDFINNDMLGIIATNFLLISEEKGIFDKDCLKLAELHSWAVDFPKSGFPVPLQDIPQPTIRVKPDWHAPELTFNQEAEYYQSKSVLGKLFRDIHLPVLSAASYESRAQQRKRKKDKNISLEDTLAGLSLDTGAFDDPISVKLRRKLRPLVVLRTSEGTMNEILRLFDHFTAELEHICFSHTLSRKATSRLTEEEVFTGTIVAKSSQPRMRKDAISRMREESTTLVRAMRKELEGGEDATLEQWATNAWTAWQVSVTKQRSFGAKSFGFIALRALFDAIKELEGED